MAVIKPDFNKLFEKELAGLTGKKRNDRRKSLVTSWYYANDPEFRVRHNLYTVPSKKMFQVAQ